MLSIVDSQNRLVSSLIQFLNSMCDKKKSLKINKMLILAREHALFIFSLEHCVAMTLYQSKLIFLINTHL